MHAFLITGLDANQTRSAALHLADRLAGKPLRPETCPDLILLTPPEGETSLTIKQVRQLKKDLAIKPISLNIKIGLILEAERLTLPAQHALLKTLEEPPAHVRLLLTAAQEELLLETIVSRCTVSRLSAEKETDQSEISKQAKIAEKILTSTPPDRLAVADALRLTKETLPAFLSHQLHYWHGELHSPSKWTINCVLQALKALQEAHKLTSTQVNHQAIIDQLFLAFPDPEG